MRDLRDEDFDNLAPSETKPLIEPGRYLARYEKREVRRSQWGEKLTFWWCVYLSANLQESSSAMLPRYYSVTRDRGGRFRFGQHHSYRIDWIAANGGKYPSVSTKLPPSVFGKDLMLVEVETVKSSAYGSLPSSCHYSKVARVIRPKYEWEIFDMYPLQPQENAEE